MKVTINPKRTEGVTICSWEVDNEAPRVSVETEYYSYSLVLTESGPVVEVWQLDANGELETHEQTIQLPQ